MENATSAPHTLQEEKNSNNGNPDTNKIISQVSKTQETFINNIQKINYGQFNEDLKKNGGQTTPVKISLDDKESVTTVDSDHRDDSSSSSQSSKDQAANSNKV